MIKVERSNGRIVMRAPNGPLSRIVSNKYVITLAQIILRIADLSFRIAATVFGFLWLLDIGDNHTIGTTYYLIWTIVFVLSATVCFMVGNYIKRGRTR